MIFPHIRISALRRDVEEKRAAFEKSRDRLIVRTREKSRPVNFLINNPKMILGVVTALFSFNKLFKELMLTNGKKKAAGGILSSFLGIAWIWKAFRIGQTLIQAFRGRN